jgi:hypothetical protein
VGEQPHLVLMVEAIEPALHLVGGCRVDVGELHRELHHLVLAFEAVE